MTIYKVYFWSSHTMSKLNEIKCTEHIPGENIPIDLNEYNIQGNINRINCQQCKNYIYLKFNGEIVDIDRSMGNNRFENKWIEVMSCFERLIYYILSQIIIPEIDRPRVEKLESLYDFADTCDTIFIRWENGRPVGFYTVKPEGTEIPSINRNYTMPVLDTIYIRFEYRRKGFGTEILHDMIRYFPNKDIGLSKPISDGMLKVLYKFLNNHKDYRLRLWEVDNCDISGSQQIIWFNLKNQQRFV